MQRGVFAAIIAAVLVSACQARLECLRTERPKGTILTFPERSELHGDILDMLRHKADHCTDERWIQNATAKMGCDLDVIAGTHQLVRNSDANVGQLLSDLSEPLMVARTGGESAISDMLVVSGVQADFAIDRVAILRGGKEFQSRQPKWPPAKMFDWVPDEEIRISFRRRWEGARDEDCRAYAVPDCRVRLDRAFARMMSAAHPTY